MYFRRVTTQDLPLLLEWAQDKRYDEFFRRTPPVCEWANPHQVESAFPTHYLVVLNNDIIGFVALTFEDPFAKSMRFGMMLVEEKRQHLKEVKEYIENLCFNELAANRLSCVVLTHREKLIERLCGYGMDVEGVLKNSSFYRGKLVDECLLAVTREKWLTYLVAPRGQ